MWQEFSEYLKAPFVATGLSYLTIIAFLFLIGTAIHKVVDRLDRVIDRLDKLIALIDKVSKL